MNRDGEFLELVNQALDERRDPLADERIQEAIVANPERLEELERLLARLGQLRAQPRRTARRALPYLGAAAAVLTFCAATWHWVIAPSVERGGHRSPAQEPAGLSTSVPSPRPQADSDSLGRVVEFEWRITHTTPTERLVTSTHSRGTTTRVILRANAEAGDRLLAVWTSESQAPRTP
ncbi:MAG: hypothetical protein IPK67_05840 [Planctomycetes bacterium]|nr:hypothetical protein [Planctomycetota bacterium]